jgi:hypothetical protein
MFRENGKRELVERKLVFLPDRPNDAFLPVRKDDTLELYVENRLKQPALMVLLVDGLNTRLEKALEKGIETMVVAKPVHFEEARSWYLDPRSSGAIWKKDKPPTWRIGGFQTKQGLKGAWKDFTVVDANQSLGYRQRFTEQIGIISAAFYDVAAKTAGEKRGGRFGFGLGPERQQEFDQAPDVERGPQSWVIHVRYDDAEALRKQPQLVTAEKPD